MKENFVEIDAIYIDILRSTLFAVLQWDFEQIDTHGFDAKEIERIEFLCDKLHKQVQSQYVKQGVHLRRNLDLLPKIFCLRKKIKVNVSLDSTDLILAIRALDVIEMEFKDDIFEFMTVTPGGLGWYNDKKRISLQDIHDCRNFLKQIGSVNIG